eukprot:scaffold2029_cov181-Amphora_coffeaeformis.AAC.2
MGANTKHSRSIQIGLLIICVELLIFCSIGTVWFYQSPRTLSHLNDRSDGKTAYGGFVQSSLRKPPEPLSYDGLVEVQVPSLRKPPELQPYDGLTEVQVPRLTINKKVEPPKHYLFNKPFYVYEDLLMFNATANGETVEAMINREYKWKHNDDLWFVNAALKHPMRTRNPEEAVMFVVPSFTNIFLSPFHHVDPCVGDLCGMDYLKNIDTVLGESPWFQRKQGADHVMVASIFSASKRLATFPNFVKCHMIALENRKFNNDDRYSVPSYYVGTPCLPRAKKYDFAMIASFKPNFTFESRRNICKWLKHDRPQYSMPGCGYGDQCPSLAQSRFGFHVRGDTYGANRLIDTILSGTVPVFTMKEQYDVLPDWIRWDDFSYFADVNNKESFLQTLDEIISDTALYEQKYAALMENRELFDWTSNVPFDTYMYMFMAQIYPQYQRPQSDSPYSALQLSKANGFDVFDPETKRVWCGDSGPAKTCDQCGPLYGSISRGCDKMCRWCEFGYTEPSEQFSFSDEPHGICVPLHNVCKEPSVEAMLENTVQPYKPLPVDLELCLDEQKDFSRIRGLLLAKTYKTGSSTAAAVTFQIAYRLGKRKGYSGPCLEHHSHDLSMYNAINTREKDASIVWTTVRDPKARALSSFAFYQAGKQGMHYTDKIMIETLNGGKNNQVAQLRTNRAFSSPGGQPTEHLDVPESASAMVTLLKDEILSTYNFIAVTERMEESLVVMKMLWNLEDGDIIVSSVKQAGGWSYNWDEAETCFHVPTIKPSPAVEEFLDTDFMENNYDFILHQFANASLDATIDSLGREQVQGEVERHRHLKKQALRYCRNKIVSPCSEDGIWQPEHVDNCFENDIGCGYRCINDFLDNYKPVVSVVAVGTERI